MVSSLTPYDLPFPPNGGSICPQHTRMVISLQRVIRSTSCLVLGFSGSVDRMALFTVRTNPRWRPPPSWKISNGHISASGRPIHFMFSYRVGFSGTADLMALFSIRTNSRWRRPPSWIISNGHISATAHDLPI